MQKRILMISYHTCPLAFKEGKETGGMNVYVYELSRSLAQKGFLVDVVTRCQEKDNAQIVEVEKGFRVIHLRAGPHHHSLDKKKLIEFIPEFVDSFQEFAQSEKISYDIIHAHYYQSGLIAEKIIFQSSQKIPFIMTFHTLALMKNLVARSENESEDAIRIDAEFSLMEVCDAIIAPSISDKKYIQYLYQVPEEKIFEIPPGVNTELFKPMEKSWAKKKLKIAQEEKIILFVGRIEPLKGIDLLLYSLKILTSQASDIPVKLLIVGGDISQHITKWSPELQHLDEIRRILHLTDQVEFVGQRSQDELPFYYNAAELVVMPSHYESFGIAAAEAMACGTPVITTNVTGISNLIDESRPALITTVNNPLLLASQMKELLLNKEEYQKVQQSILENNIDLSWNVIAQKIEEVYKKLLRTGKNAG